MSATCAASSPRAVARRGSTPFARSGTASQTSDRPMSGFRSLRWRLTALIGAVVVLAIGATYIAVYRGTGTELRNQIDRELRADAQAFSRGGVPAGTPSAADVENAARQYIASQPFRASSRL